MFQFEQVVVLNQTLVGFGDWNFVWGPLPEAVRNAQQLPPRLGPVGLALGSAIGAWFEFWWLRKHLLNQWQIERLTRTGLWKHTFPALISLGTVLVLRELGIRTTAATSVSSCSSSGSHTCDCFLYLASGELLSFGCRPVNSSTKNKPKQEEESL